MQPISQSEFQAIPVSGLARDDEFKALLPRLSPRAASVAPSSDAVAWQPIPRELMNLVKTKQIPDALQALVPTHFTQPQMDDWVRAHNHILAALKKIPPANSPYPQSEVRIEAHMQADRKWRALNDCCNRWEAVNDSTNYALFDNLLARIRLGDDNINNPPPFFSLPDGSAPIPTDAEFAQLLTRLTPPEVRRSKLQAQPLRDPDDRREGLFLEFHRPLHHVQADTVERAAQTLSEAGRRALASDFHARIVAELEAAEGVGTLSKQDKKDITVTLKAVVGSSHTVDLVLADAAKREKPALANAFREVVSKLQTHAKLSEAQGEVFLVSRQRPWAPEPVGDLREQAKAERVSKFARSSEVGERVPVQFMAKTVAGLLDGLNTALGDNNQLDAKTYAKPEMLADVPASTAGESAGGVSRRYGGGRR